MLGSLRFIPREEVADKKNDGDVVSTKRKTKKEHGPRPKERRKHMSSREQDDELSGGSEEYNARGNEGVKQDDARKEAGLEWMMRAPDRPATVAVAEEAPGFLETPQPSVRELNPYWKDHGDGLPAKKDEGGGLRKVAQSGLPRPPGVGDGGASWRLKALKRAQEQAAREGRQLDEVVEERWGSLATLTTSVATRRAAHANAHLHARRDRKRETEGSDVVGGLGKGEVDVEPGNEDEKRMKKTSREYLHDVKVEGSRMKAPKVDGSLSWKNKGGGGNQRIRPEDAAVLQAAAATYNKFDNDGNFLKSLRANEAKEGSGLSNNGTHDQVRSGESDTSARVSDNKEALHPRGHDPDTRQMQGLSNNQVAAKVMRLRLQGKLQEAQDLQDNAGNVSTSGSTTIMARLELAQRKFQVRQEGDKSMAASISRNKSYNVEDEYDEYSAAAERKKKKPTRGKDHISTQGRGFIVTQQERCQLCFENAERPKHLTVAIANHTYLMLPPRQPLVPGHCFLVPMQHEGATRNVDEGVWEELRNFKKCLVAMFKLQEKGLVFLETAMHLSRQRRHCVVECIPLPTAASKQAPLYFKKAIEEAESEWSQHNAKKLIDTSGKGLRACIPKNFPYFHVEFGLNAGFVHVIDDETTFKPQFGADVVRGILQITAGESHGHFSSLKQQQQAVQDFSKMWEPHDWTKMLD